MEWGSIVVAALTSTAFTTVVLCALGWVARKVIERWFVRNLEGYRADLQARNTKELEALRMDLRLSSFEHETRFAKLHERRAEILVDIYRQLLRVQDALTSITLSVGPSRGTLSNVDFDAAVEEIDTFATLVREGRIYFSERLCGVFEVLNLEWLNTFRAAVYLNRGTADVADAYEFSTAENSEETLLVRHEYEDWVDLLHKATKTIPNIRKDIEKEFRTILGVEQ